MGLLGNLFNDTCKGYDKIKTNKKLTYDELYEFIKDGNFEIGKPEISGSGIMRCIRFPEVDKYQIQIAITGQTITTSKIYSGAGGLLKESVGDALTNGWYNGINKENIDLNKMTRTINEEIARILKEEGLIKE